jgi:hypothetical protein
LTAADGNAGAGDAICLQEHPIGRMTSAQAEMRGGLTQIMVAAGQRVTIGEFEPDGLRA